MPAVYSPQYTTEHQEGRGDIGRVQHTWSVGAHASEEGSHSAVLVFHSLPQPQLLQVRTGPLPEGQRFHQLWSVGRLAFGGSPLFDHDMCICVTLEQDQGFIKHPRFYPGVASESCLWDFLLQETVWCCCFVTLWWSVLIPKIFDVVVYCSVNTIKTECYHSDTKCDYSGKKTLIILSLWCFQLNICQKRLANSHIYLCFTIQCPNISWENNSD